ncbi:DUF4126 domain-containing protein [Cytophagaceae bacterium DM2B3-1]|uniref:DUF4126 domain-containing protein n=1 Tax=Xanthocytophaga flava TaxID=3048013 RepID=A0ABT7CPD3_9BACT|nr:DUF4126 domain-containing protein [Xanthocytophaga flavus]MDJ1468743.1 DUF4126 domain-containing protein [Xanthocytophaga flavus]MDJ1495603.1 DUF4126 domain-containing protein [Xanthocytophaga flavus]
MEWVVSVLLGFGLSAATGFRIFVPFFVAGIAGYNHWLTLPEGIAWIGTLSAIILFGTATLIEILGYYIPWFDHLLDVIATPASTIAGTLVMSSFVTDVDPLLKWTLAIIAGGGTATLISGGTAALRIASTTVTGGAGNPLVATGEIGGSAVISLLAIFIPVITAIVVSILLIISIRFIVRKIKSRRLAKTSIKNV